LALAALALSAEEQSAGPRAFRFAGGETVNVQWFREDGVVSGSAVEQLVTQDGFVSAPLGGAVNILNKTLSEATDAIAAAVQRATELKKTNVMLALISVPPQRTHVQGEVQTARVVTLPADRDMNLAAALAEVGGVTPDADITQIKLVRQEASGTPQVIMVDGSVFYRPGLQELGPALKPGDVVIVPRAEAFMVTGEVNRVGIYKRRDTGVLPGQPLRLSHAIAAAGGVKPLADKQNVRILRIGPQGRREIIVCNMEAAMDKGDLKQDVVLCDGDQVVVAAHEGILLMGRVGSSGIYYPVGGPMTVSRLIAMAGGFGQYAKKSDVKVIRKDKPGQPIRVDMKLVMDEGRLDQDLLLNPGDMVFVGESGM
jgi:polysaccharide export outer membrane protein